MSQAPASAHNLGSALHDDQGRFLSPRSGIPRDAEPFNLLKSFPTARTTDRIVFLLKKDMSKKKENKLTPDEIAELKRAKDSFMPSHWEHLKTIASDSRMREKKMPKEDRVKQALAEKVLLARPSTTTANASDGSPQKSFSPFSHPSGAKKGVDTSSPMASPSSSSHSHSHSSLISPSSRLARIELTKGQDVLSTIPAFNASRDLDPETERILSVGQPSSSSLVDTLLAKIHARNTAIDHHHEGSQTLTPPNNGLPHTTSHSGNLNGDFVPPPNSLKSKLVGAFQQPKESSILIEVSQNQSFQEGSTVVSELENLDEIQSVISIGGMGGVGEGGASGIGDTGVGESGSGPLPIEIPPHYSDVSSFGYEVNPQINDQDFSAFLTRQFSVLSTLGANIGGTEQAKISGLTSSNGVEVDNSELMSRLKIEVLEGEIENEKSENEKLRRELCEQRSQNESLKNQLEISELQKSEEFETLKRKLISTESELNLSRQKNEQLLRHLELLNFEKTDQLVDSEELIKANQRVEELEQKLFATLKQETHLSEDPSHFALSSLEQSLLEETEARSKAELALQNLTKKLAEMEQERASHDYENGAPAISSNALDVLVRRNQILETKNKKMEFAIRFFKTQCQVLKNEMKTLREDSFLLLSDVRTEMCQVHQDVLHSHSDLAATAQEMLEQLETQEVAQQIPKKFDSPTSNPSFERGLVHCSSFDEKVYAFVRVRPLEPLAKSAVTILDNSTIEVKHKKVFSVDQVFGPLATQEEVSQDSCLASNCVFEGRNFCCISYGQTGSGKTFTIEGTPEQEGLMALVLRSFFLKLDERRSTHVQRVTINACELTPDSIRDHLASKNYVLKKSADKFPPDFKSIEVTTFDDVDNALRTIYEKRRPKGTFSDHNPRASLIVQVFFESTDVHTLHQITSQMTFVDLAGCESSAGDAPGLDSPEISELKKHFVAFGEVINSVANQRSHIPFRNSRLTQLLQSSLGSNNALVFLFLCVHPGIENQTDTLRTLSLSARAKSRDRMVGGNATFDGSTPPRSVTVDLSVSPTSGISTKQLVL